jgi:putative ABC transport system permease protein
MKSRGILLVFAVATFALIGLSQLREVTDDIKFPAKYVINLSSNNGQVRSKTVYQLLTKQSHKNKQNLFRTYLDDQGNESSFAFSEKNNQQQNYDTDITKLATVSFEGSYYSDKRFSEETLQKLAALGIHVQTAELQWYLVGSALWTEGIRAFGLWSLGLSIFFAYFSLLYLYRKNNYVARFMGTSAKLALNNWLIDSLVIMLSSIGLFLLFSVITKNSFFSMASLSFLSILVVNALLLLFLVLLGNLLFYQITKYGNILGILKGLNTPAIVNFIWFAGIVITLLMIPLILNKIDNEKEVLTEQLQSLEPWQLLENYRTITVAFPSDSQVSNGEIDIRGDLEFGKTFMSYFSENEYIFATKSAVIVPEQLSAEQKKEISKDYSKENINSKITEHVSYLNTHAYQLNAQLQNNNEQKQAQQAPATIYLPEKYKSDSDSVINATYLEFFQGSEVKRTDFEIIIVANDSKTFLFDYNGTEIYRFDNNRTQYGQEEIVVVLNMNEVLRTPSAITKYRSITNDGLFSADALAHLASNTTLSKNISDVISPYKSIKLKMNRLKDRINSAKLSVVILILVQFILVIQFFIGMLKQHIKEISVKRLLGININKVLLATFKYYLFFLLFTFLIALFITEDTLIKYFVFGGSIFEVIITFFILKGIIVKKAGDFLKGDFEI